jgi:cell division protease FtsH
MDGFESNEGVILLAATNRPDVLDPALLRPGRFDRQIVVDIPDVKGREGILKVHTVKIPVADDVKLSILARGTPGLSGADLANIVNEAALLAARRNHDKVNMKDFEDAKDKVMMGTERKSLALSEEEKKLTAYHESGHALVAKLIPGSDPVHKMTIIPRGLAIGLTHYLPVDEKHTYSKEYLDTKLVHLLGGRVAEKLVFGQLSTGAGNDIERATQLARKMVCEWGMSERLGPLTFGKKEEQIFLGREISQHRDYSEETAQEIDQEVKTIVENAEKKAEELLKVNQDKLHSLAGALLEKEILDGDQIDKILRGETLEKTKVAEEEKKDG